MSRPHDVGIAAIEMYVPHEYIEQADAEKQDDCLGKYTIGLGLARRAVWDVDREDVQSMALTAVDRLLRRNSCRGFEQDSRHPHTP